MKRFLIFSKSSFSILIFLKILTSGLSTGTAFVIQYLINFALSDNKTMKELIDKSIFALAYFIMTALVTAFSSYYSDVYCNRSIYNLRESYFKHLIKGKFSKVSQYDSAKYISAMTNDVNILSQKYFETFQYLLNNALILIFAFTYVMLINWKIGLEMVALTSLMAIVPALLRKAMERANKKYAVALEKYTAKLKEMLLGLSIIHVFSLKAQATKAVHDNNEEVFNSKRYVVFLENLSGGIAGLVSYILNIGLIITGVYFSMTGRMDIGAIVAISNLASKFYQPIQNVAGLIMIMLGTKSIGKGLMEVIDYKEDSKEKQSDAVFQKELVFENVDFSYPRSNRKVLSNISLTFEKGKKYLILGTSGSGKSTVLKLIAKINDEYKGIIRLDHESYENISDYSIHDIVTISQQNAYLFDKSLRENIDLCNTGDEEKLYQAIHLSQLSSLVDLLPSGIDTVINEETSQISGGEKIRVGIARALYKGGEIFLMDEVTSALDKENSEKIETVLLNLPQKTLLNVCHKYNEKTIDQYDEIIIIENGTVSVQGKYKDIKENPIFQSYHYKAEQRSED